MARRLHPVQVADIIDRAILAVEEREAVRAEVVRHVLAKRQEVLYGGGPAPEVVGPFGWALPRRFPAAVQRLIRGNR